jgi:ActR/RegA family two-component response regulator
MNALASAPRILLIDSNVYFSKRVSDALRHVGFEVVQCTQVSYALTMLEWNAPSAVLCARWRRFCAPIPKPRILR